MDVQAWETMLITNVTHWGQKLHGRGKTKRYKSPPALGKAKRTAPEIVLPVVDRIARHPDISRGALLSGILLLPQDVLVLVF